MPTDKPFWDDPTAAHTTGPRLFTEADIHEAFTAGTCSLLAQEAPTDAAYAAWRERMSEVWGPVQSNDVGQTPDSEGWWWMRPEGCTDRPVYVHDLPGEAPGVMGVDGKLVSVNNWPPSYWRGRVAGAK